MADIVNVQIIFEMVHPEYDTFRDALYFGLDEYAKLDKKTLEAAKQERFDSWVYQRENPPVPEPVEPQTALDEAQSKLADLAAQIADVAARTQEAIAEATRAVVATKAQAALDVAVAEVVDAAPAK